MTLAKPYRDRPAAEVYRALVRSLRRRKGFGLVFVQAAGERANQLVAELQADLPRKKIEVLDLQEPIQKLLPLIEQHPGLDQLNILIIRGLEKSLEADIKPGYGGEGDYYNLSTVPPILNHLNQQRENFRDRFGHLCFVFVLPYYAIKYFIRRAPDFFDWGTGVFTLEDEREQNAKAITDILQTADYAKYLRWSQPKRTGEILRIQALLEELPDSDPRKPQLFYELSKLFYVSNNVGAALDCCDHSLKLQPDQPQVWYSRGRALSDLGRYEEAIVSWDRAVEIKPDDHQAWYNRGNALDDLGRKEEAIASYDKALEIKPDFDWAWYNRGIALSELGRKEEAITSYDKALEIKPDKYEAWHNRGVALSELGRKEEAITSYDKALEIKPDFDWAWYNRGTALKNLGRYEEAIASYDKALEIKPDDAVLSYNKACCYALWGKSDKALRCLSRALELEPEQCFNFAQSDADFDSLRDNPRFQALLNLSLLRIQQSIMQVLQSKDYLLDSIHLST
jgi:tetratricopeptide (TPR) repeat protein